MAFITIIRKTTANIFLEFYLLPNLTFHKPKLHCIITYTTNILSLAINKEGDRVVKITTQVHMRRSDMVQIGFRLQALDKQPAGALLRVGDCAPRFAAVSTTFSQNYFL